MTTNEPVLLPAEQQTKWPTSKQTNQPNDQTSPDPEGQKSFGGIRL